MEKSKQINVGQFLDAIRLTIERKYGEDALCMPVYGAACTVTVEEENTEREEFITAMRMVAYAPRSLASGIYSIQGEGMADKFMDQLVQAYIELKAKKPEIKTF
jgi:hypothetical protein